MSARLAAACVALTACSGDVGRSSDVATSALWASFAVERTTTESPVALVHLYLESASGEPLALGSGDAITCDGFALEPTTDAEGIPDAIGPVDDVASHQFVLTRSAEPAHQATTGSPEAFTLTSGALAGTYDSQYTLTWTAPMDGAVVTITAQPLTSSCQPVTLATRSTAVESYAFDGSYFYAANQAALACSYTLDIAREQVAPYADPALAGGEQVARQIETTTLDIQP